MVVLPVRAGDAHDVQLARRLAEKRVGRDGHGAARVLDDELRNRDVNCSLHDERDCTVRHRLDGEVVPVRARPRYAEEQTPSVTRLAS